MAVIGSGSDGSIDWQIELDRDGGLLPDRLVNGRLVVTARDPVAARGLSLTLIGTEHWQVEETERDANGMSHTTTVTKRADVPRVPLALSGPVTLAAAESQAFPFELPVPSLGPATLEATVAGVSWELDAKLDVPDGFDRHLAVPVRILQPTALLRAGVVPVGEFALYDAADSATGEARATVAIAPMPVCVGAPIDGTVTIETSREMDLQEVRLELRVKVRVTASGGKEEELTLWTGRLAGPGPFGGPSRVLPFRGDVPDTFLPTIELPHSRTDATFHVILARSWARDPHLVRDVAVCTTTEI